MTSSGNRFEAARISSASARSMHIRAWQKTCLPASSAEMVMAECIYGGVPIQMMSISGIARRSAQFCIGVAWGTFSWQNFSALS